MLCEGVWYICYVKVCVATCSYQYVRLDGSMSIKKRQKMVDRFNDPSVSHELCLVSLSVT